MEPIELVFTVLTFITYYFFMGKKANNPTFRAIGWTICLVAGVLTAVYCAFIGVFSLFLINVIGIIFSGYAIYECCREIKKR